MGAGRRTYSAREEYLQAQKKAIPIALKRAGVTNHWYFYPTLGISSQMWRLYAKGICVIQPDLLFTRGRYNLTVRAFADSLYNEIWKILWELY